jgi:uncharacterized protein YhaN
MRITDVHVDGFGTLANVSAAGLQPGLNVLFAADALQQSTLLEFIRGVFGGFGDARQFGLVPTSSATVSGGSVGVEWGSRRLAIIRHGRTDGSETLAINVRQGRAEEAQALRKHLETIDSQRLRGLFTAGHGDASTVESLLQVARLDGIELVPTQVDDAWLENHRQELRERRHALLHGPNQAGRLAALAAIRDSARSECEHRKDSLRIRREDLDQTCLRLIDAVAALELELQRLHGDWQAAVSDLREVEDRLTGRTLQTIVDIEYVQESRPATPSFALGQVAEIDQQIERLRLVLKDLAASRLRVTLAGVDVMGADSATSEEAFRRQRDTLRVIEQQVQGLASTLRADDATTPTGRCDERSERAASAIDELRRRVELTCQELSRQQSAQLFRQHQVDRKSIDECELQIIGQMDRLRTERERLLDGSDNPGRSRLVHTASFERRFCECAEHTSTTRDSCPPTKTRTVTIERVREVSIAREGDRELRDRLSIEVAGRWHDWQSALRSRCDLEREWIEAESERERCRQDVVLDQLEAALSVAEVELADAQKSWQTLLTVEAALREVEQTWDGARASRILTEASGYLAVLTEGRYREMGVKSTNGRVVLVSNDSSSVDSVPPMQGVSEQAALALRLALAEEYSRRGIDFPLILEDVTLDGNGDRVGPAAQVLSHIASIGRQVFILTDRELVVDALEGAGASVHVLPGASCRDLVGANPTSAETTGDGFIELEPVHFAQQNAESVAELPKNDPVEALPVAAEPAKPSVWRGISLDCPIEAVPSIDIEAATHLRQAGVFTVSNLFDLDVASCPELAGLSGAELPTWRAEAGLLLESPFLEGPDAQLLVACGVLTRRELSEWDSAKLHQRIQRFRGSAPPVWHVWIQKRQTWPREADVERWIEGARHAWDGGPDDHPRLLPTSESVEIRSASGRRQHKPRRRKSRGQGRRTSAQHMQSAGELEAKFYLSLESPIIDAPAIGPRTSRLLQRAGVATVAHLLNRSPEELAKCIGDAQIDAARIDDWQCQSRLMCQIAGLRGHDSQLLVSCGIRSTLVVASQSAVELLAIIRPFAESKEGQRILRSSSAPDLDEAAAWIRAAAEFKTRKAA